MKRDPIAETVRLLSVLAIASVHRHVAAERVQAQGAFVLIAGAPRPNPWLRIAAHAARTIAEARQHLSTDAAG